MLKVVLDTNTALGGMLWDGAAREFIVLALRRRLQLCGTNETIEEFRDVIFHRDGHEGIQNRIEELGLSRQALLREYAKPLTIFPLPKNRLKQAIVVADPDDDVFVYAALASGSNYVISRDKHLLGLGQYKRIQIVRPEAFLAAYRKAGGFTRQAGGVKISTRRTWKIWGKPAGQSATR